MTPTVDGPRDDRRDPNDRPDRPARPDREVRDVRGERDEPSLGRVPNRAREAQPWAADGHGLPLAELVEGVLDERERRAAQAHLLGCPSCSAQVSLARLGREAAALDRFDPDDERVEALHERLMDALPAAARSGAPIATRPRRARSHPSRRALLVAASGLVVGGAAVELLRRTSTGANPPVGTGTAGGGLTAPAAGAAVLDTAVADYRADRLPAGGRPATSAPDLRELGLSVERVSGGSLAEQPVSAFDYRSGAGDRVVVYVSDRPFTSPALQDAQYIPKAVQGMWVTWIPGAAPTLVLGENERLVHDVCEALI